MFSSNETNWVYLVKTKEKAIMLKGYINSNTVLTVFIKKFIEKK